MKKLSIKLSVNELNIVLESLGNLPDVRVYELINQLQVQAKEQLNGSADTHAEPEEEGTALAKAEMRSN